MVKNKNHHLESHGQVWYLVAMANGKRIKKALSPSITDARRLRDEYLEQIRVSGDIPRPQPAPEAVLFGQVVKQWAEKKVKRVKASTWREYQSIMNGHILPRFGNTPIASMTCYQVEDFIDGLSCGNQRKNGIMVPIRDVFKYATKGGKGGIVERNIMRDVDNLKPEESDIRPLNIDEVKAVLEHVDSHYKDFFAVAFYTGMRFGEMAALKWKNVDFDRRIIRVIETRVYGNESSPKTNKSKRDVELIGPAFEALLSQQGLTGKGKYVFIDADGQPLIPGNVREGVWTKALVKAAIEYRPMRQTRHTFATMMLDAGEDIGWVQSQLGHASLQMIFTRYYSWIKRPNRNDGSAFMANMYQETAPAGNKASPKSDKLVDFTPILHLQQKTTSGREPETIDTIGVEGRRWRCVVQ